MANRIAANMPVRKRRTCNNENQFPKRNVKLNELSVLWCRHMAGKKNSNVTKLSGAFKCNFYCTLSLSHCLGTACTCLDVRVILGHANLLCLTSIHLEPTACT